MPIEPESNRWSLPNPAAAPTDDELLAVGADLAPGTMLAAYRSGVFPMGIDDRLMGWWSPNPRGILRPLDFHTSRSLRRTQRRFEMSVDTDFDAVVEACANPDRPRGWISADFKAAYSELHRLGWAHSVEARLRGELVGGLFGIEIGGLFAAESKFHTETDASKAAVQHLAHLLAKGSAAQSRIIDVQWLTPHLESLGAIELTRESYLESLAAALSLPPVLSRT